MVLSTPQNLLPTSAALLLGERSPEPLTAAAWCLLLGAVLCFFPPLPLTPRSAAARCSGGGKWLQSSMLFFFLFFFFSFGLRLENRKMKAGLEPLGAAWHGRRHRVCVFVPGERSESEPLPGFILNPFFCA